MTKIKIKSLFRKTTNKNIAMAQEEKTLLKMFFKFLKENDALEQYKINAINEALHSYNNQTKQIGNALMPLKTIKNKFNALYGKYITITTEKTIYEIINYSFVWGDTPQGFNYWSQLSAKWQIYFHSIELAKFQK